MLKLHRIPSYLAVCVCLNIALSGHAVTVIGDWESGAREGWVDWNNGSPTTEVGPPKFEFNSIGATLGTGAIQYNSPGGYTQWLAIKLQNDINDPLSNGIADYRPGFLENTKLAFDLTFDAAEQTAGNDFANLGLFLNSNTFGFTRIGDPANDNVPESVTPFVGYNGGKAWNPSLLQGVQTSTWVYDIGFLQDGDPVNGEVVEGDYIELIFEEFSNNTNVLHLDNVRFFTPVELAADFDEDDDVDGDDFAAWKRGFGLSGQARANGDSNGDGVVDGTDFLAWQREFGTTAGGLAAINSVPEPSAMLLAGLALPACFFMAAGRSRIPR